jgi:hypothetical protein
MNLTTKSLLYNFICFAIIFFIVYYLVDRFTNLTGWMKPVTAGVMASLLAPKFQAVKTRDGEKLFMKWLFIKGVKEIR